ncbi:response regulator transcription factor [Rhizobacter sp. Root404]|jgi:DNA-binding response OmpR family regulator|uniref:response regulator transcription factor n=1 Tax=Rhizobacter sp. Root404 TaxID=1736528 RepID=UPI0006F98F52|nr:response regulator transcription factor [Rhizobacter sp. Root404]KQW35593.1 transcriptional regulator [Rhizobacter sp. Root404]
MLPKTLALVDDDAEFSEFLAQYLQEREVAVRVFHDSDELLTDREPYDFDFYVLDLSLPGVDGLELIRLLRRRTSAGILVVSGRLAPDVFDSVINAGADMYLAKPVRFEQVALAVKAVHRRSATAREQVSNWRLDRRGSELVAPDGARIALSETDLLVMECFAAAAGATVTREALRERLGRPAADEPDNLLHATIYRLRRRIERATPVLVPLQSQSRVGYVFRATLSSG